VRSFAALSDLGGNLFFRARMDERLSILKSAATLFRERKEKSNGT